MKSGAATVDSRVLEILRTPAGAAGSKSNQSRSEPLQLLRYLPNQKYDVHADYIDPSRYDQASGVFGDMSSVVEGGRNRLATVIWYASSPESGGETHFPRAGGLPEHEEVSVNCAGAQADSGLKVPARRRQATLFYNLRPVCTSSSFRVKKGEQYVQFVPVVGARFFLLRTDGIDAGWRAGPVYAARGLPAVGGCGEVGLQPVDLEPGPGRGVGGKCSEASAAHRNPGLHVSRWP